jgi:Fic family protein
MSSDPVWPAVNFERYDWMPTSSTMSRRARARHNGPYDAAVSPSIAELDVVLPPALVTEAEEATAEIARFDQELGNELAPFAAVLLRTESAASSKIENLTASARAIAEAELVRGSNNAALIVANQKAMTAAIDLADRIDADAILAMHAALLGHSDPDIAGKWRTQQVWIGGSDFGPHDAAFVPPHATRVPAAIDDLIAFIARHDIPRLVHVALAHAQFETIHPFPDGNGRTGRALVHAQLRHAQVTRHVTVPVSAGLLVDIDRYFEALTAYRHGDPAPIVERFIHASFAAITNGRELVADLRATRERWHDTVNARRDATAWRIAGLLLRHPVINASLVATALDIAPRNVYRSLQPLIDAGVLVEFTNRQRDQMWRCPDVLAALDAFAARAGRRQPPTQP